MFKRKKTLKSKKGNKKVSVKKTTSSKGHNAGVKRVALKLIDAPTKKNKDAMLKAIIRSL